MTDAQAPQSRLLKMVVDVVSNDYESYQLVIDEVKDWAKEESIPCSVDDIRAALAESVSKGYVRPYTYSQSDSKFKEATLDKNGWETSYFFATAIGKGLLA